MIRSYPIPRREDLTLEEVLELCQTSGITLDVPYSHLEAEAIHRNVSLSAIGKAYLLAKLVEAGLVT